MAWRSEDYTGWGRALSATGDVARPERHSSLKSLPSAPARGGRRSYGDACLNDGGKIIDMTRLDRVLAFDTETGRLTLEGGVELRDLMRVFAPRGWLLPVIPGTGFATVGGAIAMDVHGKNHHGAGSFGQHVAELTLWRRGAEHVLRPGDAGFAATIGGVGQTGTILSATIQMKAITGNVMRVRERRMPDLATFLTELDSSEATYNVGWIDATARGAALGRGILEEGEIHDGRLPKAGRSKSVPIDAPGFALAPPIVKAFNALYYARVPAAGRTLTRSFEDFFTPLDRIHDWNRLYGKRGFHQFQCVLPEAGPLTQMMEAIAGSGLASPLAVLKRMGPGSAGLMSFPMEGYTLAVDFPARDKAADLIARLEAMTREAGGRIYFAKDALSTPEAVAEMYPNRAAWAAEVNALDPERAYETDLVRRLKLREAP